MAMKDSSTQVEKTITRIKNNPIIASLIVFGIIIIAVSTFTNAVQNLLGHFIQDKNPAIADINGKWASSVLTSPFDKNDTFRIVFEFEVKGDIVLGTLREVSTTNRYNAINSILDGKIQDNRISFHVQKTSIFGKDSVRYKDLFYGTLSENELHFVLQSDRPWSFPPRNFIARRE